MDLSQSKPLTFGTVLPGGFSHVNNHLVNGIAFLHEVRDLVKERSILEKEHAKNMDALHRKHSIKLEKKMREFSIGVASLLPGTGEEVASTTMHMWSVLVSTLDGCTRERCEFSDKLISDVSDHIKFLAIKMEESRKKVQYGTYCKSSIHILRF
jgi:hypothetical protein